MEKIIEVQVAELLCSKLCHDLISPIGAINNGLEFLEEDADVARDDVLKLIKSSARQAADKLSYFRLAAGKASLDDTIKLKVVQNLIEKLAIEKKIEIVWIITEKPLSLNINMVRGKLLLNLALIAFECLPRQGRVEFCMTNNIAKPDIIIKITGDKCMIRNEVKNCINKNFSESSLTVQNILTFYCKNLAKVCKQTLRIQKESTSEISFSVL